MSDQQNQINQLLRSLEVLQKKQDDFSKEIDRLRSEVVKLQPTQPEEAEAVVTPTQQPVLPSPPLSQATPKPQFHPFNPKPQRSPLFSGMPEVKKDFEKFIGENLINKIGILITVLGVAVGAKYAIDNELISPLTRIILGYLAGLALLGVAIRLKKNYDNFSAVLLSGSTAILYFITFAAYDFYGLIPQSIAFGLMVIFTVFTVIAALHYDKQVIALIGLVGAYAVPFLLGDNNGNPRVLFSYMAIVNIGILTISFRKYWKLVYYSSFVFTWLIYLFWYWGSYQDKKDFETALIFQFLFFVIFYLSFLAYKLIREEKFVRGDIVLVLANSFIYYGVGYSLLDQGEVSRLFLGLFTLGNAIIHFIAGFVVYRRKLADKNLFYLITGLVLVFICIAAPVQLDGNWVTLFWIGQALLLFWLGRTKNISFYEKLSYPLISLACFSMFQDLLSNYNSYYPDVPESRVTPLLNVAFLSSVIFLAALGAINYLDRRHPAPYPAESAWSRLIVFLLPAFFLVFLYYSFHMEIASYWNQLYLDSGFTSNAADGLGNSQYWNEDLKRFESIWQINFLLLFLTGLAFANLGKWKSQELGTINLVLLVIGIVAFLTKGLLSLSDLRTSYLNPYPDLPYQQGIFHLAIRYVGYLCVAAALFAFYRYGSSSSINKTIKHWIPDIFIHITIIWIASSELINWMEISRSAQSDKLGISILWGVYSLLLIVLGIYRKKKYLRLAAIVLFGLTLLKLFFYDISHLDTIAKTIVLVSLGVLLLVISFLYNKYKHLIADETNR